MRGLCCRQERHVSRVELHEAALIIGVLLLGRLACSVDAVWDWMHAARWDHGGGLLLRTKLVDSVREPQLVANRAHNP